MQKSTTHQRLQNSIQTAYKRLGTWQRVGDKFGISRGLAYRIGVEGYNPKMPHLRATLGLPALAPAPVCPKHHVVHIRKTCPSDTPRKPREKTWPREPQWCRICRKWTAHGWSIGKGLHCRKCGQL